MLVHAKISKTVLVRNSMWEYIYNKVSTTVCSSCFKNKSCRWSSLISCWESQPHSCEIYIFAPFSSADLHASMNENHQSLLLILSLS